MGTEKEKRRTQTIADSLDLGSGDLQVEGNDGGVVVGESEQALGRRKTVATETALLGSAL